MTISLGFKVNACRGIRVSAKEMLALLATNGSNTTIRLGASLALWSGQTGQA